MVRDPAAPHLEGLSGRDEEEGLRLDSCATGPDDRVPKSMPAVVVLELGTNRRPCRRPEIAGRRVAQVDVAASGVHRCVVVAVPGESAKPGIAEERVSAGRVRDNAKEVFAAQIVDPGQRSVRSRDQVLASLIVEAAEASRCPSFAGGSGGAYRWRYLRRSPNG